MTAEADRSGAERTLIAGASRSSSVSNVGLFRVERDGPAERRGLPDDTGRR